ncbi:MULTISPECIES: LysR family transcriptional regulator [unclassified Cedecea]|uniref:LysR family transcriptional regulator n=1 Tax=unclassified Cedecea TaxID=2649846 RepID=UPI00301910B6
MHKTTLEQWALLELVIELGSFAKAAEATFRSQSSVSYNLALLQERLGVSLLKPEGRKAVLTPEGELLLAQVRPLLKSFHYVESRAATLKNGIRTRIDLVVDCIFPRARLFAILHQFQRLHASTQVHLTEILETDTADLAEADVMVLTRRQDLTGRGQWLRNVDFVAVAHRDHPLHQLPAPLEEADLANYPLIHLAGQNSSESSPTADWTFSTLDAACEAVTWQVGYGWLPEERIAPQIENGTLKPLPLSHGARRATPLHLIVKKDLAPLDEPITTLLTLFQQPEC